MLPLSLVAAFIQLIRWRYSPLCSALMIMKWVLPNNMTNEQKEPSLEPEGMVTIKIFKNFQKDVPAEWLWQLLLIEMRNHWLRTSQFWIAGLHVLLQSVHFFPWRLLRCSPWDSCFKCAAGDSGLLRVIASGPPSRKRFQFYIIHLRVGLTDCICYCRALQWFLCLLW